MALALDPVDTPSDLGFWTAGRITVGIKDGTADVLEFSTGGISFGADYRLSDMLTLGIGGGFGGDRTVIGTNGSEAEAAAHYLAIYGTFRPAADFFIDGVLGAGLIELSSRRFVSATGELALGDRVGQQVFGSLATGYDYREGDFSLGAYGRVQGAFASLGAFTESGGGPLGALSYSDQQVWSLTGVLGLRADYSFHLEGGTLTPAVRVEYRGGTEGTSDANVSYAGLLDGPLYGLAGGSGAQNALTLGLETDFAFEDGPTISLGYRTRIGASGERSHSLTFYLGGQL